MKITKKGIIKVLVILLVSAVFLFSILLIYLLIRSNSQKKEFIAKVEEIRSAGYPVESKNLEKWELPSGGKNGLAAYKKAVHEIKEFNDGSDNSNEVKLKDFFDDSSNDSYRNTEKESIEKEFYVKHSAVVKRILDEQLKSFWLHLKDVMNSDYLDFESRYRDGYMTSTKWLMESRTVVKIMEMRLKQYVYLKQDVQKALNENNRQLLYINKYKHIKSVIDLLIYISMCNIAANDFQLIVNELEPQSKDLRVNSKEFIKFADRMLKNTQKAFIAERAMLITEIEKNEVFSDKDNLWAYKLFAYGDGLACIDEMKRLIEATEKPWTRVKDYVMIQDELPVAGWDRTHIYRYMILPPLKCIIKSSLFGRTKLLMASIAGQIYADRLEGKAYPENLKAYPPDPFTGKPFKLLVCEDLLIIHSLGCDLESNIYQGEILKQIKMGVYRIHSKDFDDLFFCLPIKANPYNISTH